MGMVKLVLGIVLLVAGIALIVAPLLMADDPSEVAEAVEKLEEDAEDEDDLDGETFMVKGKVVYSDTYDDALRETLGTDLNHEGEEFWVVFLSDNEGDDFDDCTGPDSGCFGFRSMQSVKEGSSGIFYVRNENRDLDCTYQFLGEQDCGDVYEFYAIVGNSVTRIGTWGGGGLLIVIGAVVLYKARDI